MLFGRDEAQQGGLLLVDVLGVGAEVSLAEAVEEASDLGVEFADFLLGGDH